RGHELRRRPRRDARARRRRHDGDRQPRQGRGGAGGPEHEPRARARRGDGGRGPRGLSPSAGAPPRAAPLLRASVAVPVFLPSVGGDFLNYDDDHYVRRSRPVREGDVATILDPRAPRAELGEEYLPVRDLTYALDARLFGVEGRAAVGFRATSLLWYA